MWPHSQVNPSLTVGCVLTCRYGRRPFSPTPVHPTRRLEKPMVDRSQLLHKPQRFIPRPELVGRDREDPHIQYGMPLSVAANEPY